MKILVDAHTHTLASGHAYSTILENAKAAAEKGLELLAITDHTPGISDSPDILHFINYGVLDKTLFGVEMLYGAELNILNFEGEVSLPPFYLKQMGLCIASIHTECMEIGTRDENTKAILNAMQNPYVHIIGHPNDAAIPLDYTAIAKEAARTGTLLEVNNTTLRPVSHRKGTKETLVEMLKACMQAGAAVSLGTDAHFATAVGGFSQSLVLLEELRFPEELVANTSGQRFKKKCKHV